MGTEAEAFDIIGDVYDCAMVPAKWPQTLERLSGFLGGVAVGINVKDPAERLVVFLAQWGGNDEYRRSYRETYFALNPAMTCGWFVDLNEPVTCSGYAGRSEWLKCRMYKEWMQPQEYIDACGVNLTKDSRRHAMLSVIRHQNRGWFNRRDFGRIRLIGPHIRRAVGIADMLGRTSLQHDALSSTLDLLTVGVILVDRNGRIAHANQSAQRLLDSRSAITREGDHLSARDPKAAAALREAVSTSASGEAARVPASGIAVPIIGKDGTEFAAWILPLDGGLRTELAAPFAASVAVFVRELGRVSGFPGELFVKRYGITPAECRVLMMLTQGMTPAETAVALGVSEPTVKTHLQRLFTKTSTKRQAELMRLTMDVLPPASLAP